MVQCPSSRESGGAGAGLFGLTTPTKVLDRLAVEGCQPRLSDLGSSAPSQQPALTHGSCAPSLSRLLLRYRLPNLKVGWGAEGLRPGSGSSSKSKGEAVGSRRRRVGGRLVSRGKSREGRKEGRGGGHTNWVVVCLRWGDVVAWRARWTLGQREGRKFVKEKRGERVKQEEGNARRFYEPASAWGSRWPVAEGTGAATGAAMSKEPRTPSHVGSVDFRSAIDTELGRRSQEAADLADGRWESTRPRRISGMGGVGGSGETVFQVWRGNKDPCHRLSFNAGLYSFSAWSQFRSHHHTTTSDRPGPSTRLSPWQMRLGI